MVGTDFVVSKVAMIPADDSTFDMVIMVYVGMSS